jgi:hypothetical protein
MNYDKIKYTGLRVFSMTSVLMFLPKKEKTKKGSDIPLSSAGIRFRP